VSLSKHRIGWVGALCVSILSPLAIFAVHGFVDGFIEGLGGQAGWPHELFAVLIGIVLPVLLVMSVSSALSRRRGG
jgi:hypothetical protein